MAKQNTTPQTNFNPQPQVMFQQDSDYQIKFVKGSKLKWSRMTKVYRPWRESVTKFEWPPIEKREEFMYKGFYINGFENNHDKGLGNWFNFVSSNEDRSDQRDEGYVTKFPFMMPKDAKIKTIDFYLNQKCLFGFKFYDKNKKQIFQIGYTTD
jgi:hypothetical protein